MQEVGRRMRKFLVGLLLIVAVTAIGLAIWEPLAAKAPAAPAFKPTDVQIARDGFGVPHIFGKTDADVAYGVAYAHAEDDFATLQEVLAMTRGRAGRSEEHTSELQPLMRISYAVFCLNKRKTKIRSVTD